MLNSNLLIQKKWFKWLFIGALLLFNILSYQLSNDFFVNVSQNNLEEIANESNIINSGSRILNWAQEILRFFRNPQ